MAEILWHRRETRRQTENTNVSLTDGKDPAYSPGFEFLGYRFEGGQRWVRKRSLKALKDKIRSKTGRSRGVSLAQLIAELNPLLKGWFGYFKHAHRAEFGDIDGFVRRRLRAILRRHERRTGRLGKSLADHKRWPNAYFAERGLSP